MDELVIVRGGGDIATGTAHKLFLCGFGILILEDTNPSAIRRRVSFCEAVYDGSHTVEGVTCMLADSPERASKIIGGGNIAIMADPKGKYIRCMKPAALVDGIMAKRNLGTTRDMAPITVGLGPGFEAGKDVDAVIETMRGHSLGRVIYDGSAKKNTGMPGLIGEYTKERVIHSPASGNFRSIRQIADSVKKGEIIAQIETNNGEVPVKASIDGLLRGMIRCGRYVGAGFKVADIDPRFDEYDNCFTISDKARCIAGGALEAIMYLKGRQK